jgi:hypothetical protein
LFLFTCRDGLLDLTQQIRPTPFMEPRQCSAFSRMSEEVLSGHQTPQIRHHFASVYEVYAAACVVKHKNKFEYSIPAI